MPRRSRRKILGKRPQLEQLRCEEDLEELSGQLRREWREQQAEHSIDVQYDTDASTDD